MHTFLCCILSKSNIQFATLDSYDKQHFVQKTCMNDILIGNVMDTVATLVSNCLKKSSIF